VEETAAVTRLTANMQGREGAQAPPTRPRHSPHPAVRLSSRAGLPVLRRRLEAWLRWLLPFWCCRESGVEWMALLRVTSGVTGTVPFASAEHLSLGLTNLVPLLQVLKFLGFGGVALECWVVVSLRLGAACSRCTIDSCGQCCYLLE